MQEEIPMEFENIENTFFQLRGLNELPDFDPAMLYDVEKQVLNHTVKRNLFIFPDDCMFRLPEKEWNNRSSPFMMNPFGRRPGNAFPYPFAEHAVTMLANVLKTERAGQTGISILSAFIR